MEKKQLKIGEAITSYISDKKPADLCDTLGPQIEVINEFSRKIVNSAPMSILVLDKDGIIVFTNDYFKNFAETSLPLGKNIFDLAFFQNENLCPEYEKLLKNGAPVKKDYCKTTNTKGEIKYINIIAIPLFDKEKKIEGGVSMAIDSTETMKAKIKLEELNASLEKKVEARTQELSKTNKKLQKTLETRLRFIADASHELRTPLSIIRLNTDLKKSELGNAGNCNTFFSVIDSEIEKMAEILEDLSLISSIEDGGREKLIFGDVYINNLVSGVAKRVMPLALEKKISIFWKKSDKNPTIVGDKIKLEKLFLNLVRNSIKYGKTGGEIKITVTEEKKANLIKISVKDNGIGISEDDLPHVFDRFFRANTEESKAEGGFGLGLSMCKWIAEKHNGFIESESVLGEGSIFTVSLPTNLKSNIMIS